MGWSYNIGVIQFMYFLFNIQIIILTFVEEFQWKSFRTYSVMRKSFQTHISSLRSLTVWLLRSNPDWLSRDRRILMSDAEMNLEEPTNKEKNQVLEETQLKRSTILLMLSTTKKLASISQDSKPTSKNIWKS